MHARHLQQARHIKAHLRRHLLSWYDTHHRKLPWRGIDDAYGVWVSEIMLQQTQVDRVVGYWQRFMAAFPTVTELARAPLPHVLSLWSGLGYYSRARNLHRAAQDIVAKFNGRLPADVEQLRSLPGFGRYTAGAVASIAFQLSTPLVDGNVARVFSRLLELEGRPGNKERETLLWEVAELWVQGKSPGDWNQALMELGATICLPRGAQCARCPVSSHCGALASKRVDELPWPKTPPKRKRLDVAVAVVRRGEKLWLARRAERGLFGGLWEMPSAVIDDGATAEATLQNLVGERAKVGAHLATVERTLTHRQLVLHVHEVVVSAKSSRTLPGYEECQWADARDASALGMSSAMRAAITATLTASHSSK